MSTKFKDLMDESVLEEGVTVDKSTWRPSCFEIIFWAITRISPSWIWLEDAINSERSSEGSISFCIWTGKISN